MRRADPLISIPMPQSRLVSVYNDILVYPPSRSQPLSQRLSI